MSADFKKCEVVGATAKALKVRIPGKSTAREVWVPRSVIDDDSEVFDADENAEGTLVVADWWAEKEGLL